VSRWFRNHPPTLRRRHRQGSASATVGVSALDNGAEYADVHDDDTAAARRRSVSTKSILSRSIFKTRGRGRGGKGIKWAIEKEEERDSQGGLGTATANEQSKSDKVQSNTTSWKDKIRNAFRLKKDNSTRAVPLLEIPATLNEEIILAQDPDEEEQEVTDEKQGYETSVSISLSLSLTKLLAKSGSSSSSSSSSGGEDDDGGGRGNLRNDSCSEEIGKWSEDLQRTALNDTTKKEREFLTSYFSHENVKKRRKKRKK